MKTASETTSTPATDAQYGELKTMFERTAREAVADKDRVQNLLGRWDKIGPLVGPILQRYCLDLTLVDSALLEPVTILVSVPGNEAFTAKDKFKVGTQDGVKIGWLGDNFKKHFLSGAGRIEIDVPAQDLRVHQLRKASTDPPIIAELGAEELIETNLATMWELMKKQGSGQAGDLLVNGYANVFYIRDDNGVVWAVSCFWISDTQDWGVGADAFSNPDVWYVGLRFFSR